VIVNRDDQPIVISFNVEYDAFRRNYAGRPVLRFKLRRAFPCCLNRFCVPGIQLIFHSSLKLVLNSVLHEIVQGTACDHSHIRQYSMIPQWEQGLIIGTYSVCVRPNLRLTVARWG